MFLFAFGDFAQLPPVMGLPLYTVLTSSALSDNGATLLQLRNCQVTESDWRHLSSFDNLFPTIEAVSTTSMLVANQLLLLKLYMQVLNKASADDAGGLYPVAYCTNMSFMVSIRQPLLSPSTSLA